MFAVANLRFVLSFPKDMFGTSALARLLNYYCSKLRVEN